MGSRGQVCSGLTSMGVGGFRGMWVLRDVGLKVWIV